MSDKVLIIGAGSMGLKHADVIKKLQPSSEIYLYKRAGSLRNLSNINGVFNCLDKCIELKPKHTIIACPAIHHLEYAKLFLEKTSTNVLIEKPLSISKKAYLSYSDTFLNSNSFIQVGYNLRFNESLIALKDLIDSERFGKPVFVDARVAQYLPDWRPKIDYKETVSAKAELGGGVLLELSHEIDYLRWIFGEFNWVSAWHGKLSNLEIDVEDASLITSQNINQDDHEVMIRLSMDFINFRKTRSCSVYCSEALIEWDGILNQLRVFERGSNDWIYIKKSSSDINQSYISQWRSFISQVNEGNNPKIGIEDGIRALEVIDAIKESHLHESKKIFLSNYD